MSEKKLQVAWGLVIGGIIAIILGLVFIIWPYMTAAAFSVIVGVLFAATGIACIVNYATGWGLAYRSGWILANGITDVLLGIIFIIWPIAGGWFLSILLGCGIIAVAVWTMVYGGQVARAMGAGLFAMDIIVSILYMIIGIWMLFDPAAMTFLFGFFAILEGTWLVVSGFVR